MYFRNYGHRKTWLNKSLKSPLSEDPLDKQHAKWDQTLLKSEHHIPYDIFWSLWRQLSWKKSLLVICKFLRLFLNTLTAHHKNSLLNRQNLTQPIQMPVSQKQKIFSEFASAFLKGILNSEHFQSKDHPHGWCILKITESEIRGEINV